jgi:transcriptional regulator with XRE-family HTH domain
LHNRIASRFIFSVLDARGWSEAKLAKQSGVARSVISMHLSGARKIAPKHLVQYLGALNQAERPGLMAAWVRDHLGNEMATGLLNVTGDHLGLDVRKWTPTLDPENTRMLAWWATEIERDGELRELFQLLSARAGYRSMRKATSPATRRRQPRQKLAAFVALLMPLFNSAPIEPQAHMAATAMASVAVPAVLAVTGTASAKSDDEEDAAFDWQNYQESASVPEQQPTKRARAQRRAYHSRQQHRANRVQRLADKTVNPELRRLRRVVRRITSR